MSKQWEELYREAMLELNPERLADRVQEAQIALRQRLQQVDGRSECSSEKRNIDDALLTLDLLLRTELRRSA